MCRCVCNGFDFFFFIIFLTLFNKKKKKNLKKNSLKRKKKLKNYKYISNLISSKLLFNY